MKYFFPVRNIQQWNEFPHKVLNSLSLELFRRTLLTIRKTVENILPWEEHSFFFFGEKKKVFMWGPKFFKTTDDKTMKIIFIFPQEPTTVIKPKSEDISTYKADNDRFTNKYSNCRILGLQGDPTSAS